MESSHELGLTLSFLCFCRRCSSPILAPPPPLAPSLLFPLLVSCSPPLSYSLSTPRDLGETEQREGRGTGDLRKVLWEVSSHLSAKAATQTRSDSLFLVCPLAYGLNGPVAVDYYYRFSLTPHLRLHHRPFSLFFFPFLA